MIAVPATLAGESYPTFNAVMGGRAAKAARVVPAIHVFDLI
jgi:hypothetical protein